MTRPVFVFAFVGALALAGCSGPAPVFDGKVAKHSVDNFDEAPRAVFANQIPVYPGASITDATGNQSWGDTPDTYSEGMTWWFEVTGATESVVAFYDTALPEASRKVDENGEIIWTLKPSGGREGDEVAVILSGRELRISEDVYGGRDRLVQNAANPER